MLRLKIAQITLAFGKDNQSGKKIDKKIQFRCM